jgi:hypothetical protein
MSSLAEMTERVGPDMTIKVNALPLMVLTGIVLGAIKDGSLAIDDILDKLVAVDDLPSCCLARLAPRREEKAMKDFIAGVQVPDYVYIPGTTFGEAQRIAQNTVLLWLIYELVKPPRD